MKIKTQIKKYKNSLIEKCKEKGLYENFGEKEQRKLKENYNVYEGNNAELIQEFNEWCYSFEGE